jgi:hypothetical protein
MTTFYRVIDGKILRAGKLAASLAEVVRMAQEIGVDVVEFTVCPYPEHDQIAWLRGGTRGFGFDVLPRKDGPELKPSSPAPF